MKSMLTNREKLVVSWLLSMQTVMITAKQVGIPPEKLHSEILKHMNEIRKTNTPDITPDEMMSIEHDIEDHVSDMRKIFKFKTDMLDGT